MVKKAENARMISNRTMKRLNSAKTVIFVGVPLVLVIAAVVVLLIFHLNEASNDSYVAMVNVEPIQEKEYLRQLKLETTNTFEYFKQKYKADAAGDFWNKDFNGEVPVDYVRDRALSECIKIKIQQVLAREYGLVDDITYKAFLKELSVENKRRKEAVNNHLAIYGPVQYDENGYFTQILSNLIIKTKDKLLEGEFKPTETQLKDYYEKVKDKLYKKEDSIRFNMLYISYGKEDGTFTETERNEAIDKMRGIKVRIDKGESFDEIAKSDPQYVKDEEKNIDADSASFYSKVEPELFGTVKMLESGRISDVLDEPMQKRVEIVKVLHKESSGYKAFDEFKDSVQSNYIDEKYDEMVKKLVQEAKVEINEAVYKKTYPD